MSDEFFYPNVWGLSILLALEEILGKNGVSAALNLAGLAHYVNNYPPDNIKKEFPFEAVSKLQQSLWDLNGSRGAQVLAVRSGESTFNYSLEKFGKVQQAAAAAMNRGIDLSSQQARRVSPDDFERFDYVLAMDSDNYEILVASCPSGMESRLRLFMDFAPDLETREVPDPYYGGGSGFERVLDLIEQASEGLLTEIRRQHGL